MTERGHQYRTLVEALGPALSRVAAGYEADPELRRDLLQDIHAAIWHGLGRFDGRSSLKTWAWRVAHNVSAKWVARHRVQFVELDEQPVVSEPEGALDRRRALARLEVLVRALPIASRQLLLLSLEGEDHAVIADVTGLSRSNVATRLHRLKASLARHFPGVDHA